MKKRYRVLYLNGINKGKEVEVEASYTTEEEQLKKDKLKFVVNGIEYAGYCRRCGYPVREDEASYISNTNYYGTLEVDVFHRRCL